MKSNSQIWMLAACCAGLFATGGANAASSASVSLTGFNIALTDLAPSDGQDAVLSFIGTSFASVYADPLAGYNVRPNPDPAISVANGWQPAAGAFTDQSAAISVSGMAADAAVVANALTATSSASQGMTSARAFIGTTLDPANSFNFSLTPNSSFTITVQASVQATSDGASSGDFYWQNAAASAAATLAIQNLDGADQGGTDALQVSTAWGNASVLTQSRLLTLTYSNASDQVVHGSFYLMGDTTATAAVPEPSTMLLTAAGFLLTWAGVRRKRG